MNNNIKIILETYDALTDKIKTDLNNQFSLGRINGNDYATVYAQLMDRCLQLAVNQPSALKDNEVKDSQVALYNRQIKGFDDKLKMDLTKIQLDSWSMMFSSGLLEEKPIIISNDDVSLLYGSIENQLFNISTPVVNLVKHCSLNTTYTGYIENYNPNTQYTITSKKLKIQDYHNGTFGYTTTGDKDSDVITVIAKKGNNRRVVNIDISWE